MGHKRKSKKAKRAALGQAEPTVEDYQKVPHTFVITRGEVGKPLTRLCYDLRKILEPYTARNLKTRKSNKLKDFVSTAAVLHVTHVLMITRTEQGGILRLVRCPNGPTLTFRIVEFSLMRDILSSQEKQTYDTRQYEHHPLLVMSNFDGSQSHLKLVGSIFQNMLPSISVKTVKLANVRRSMLLSRDAESGFFQLRHYSIAAKPVGVSSAVGSLMNPSSVVDLSDFKDISEFISKGTKVEAEDDTITKLPQSLPGAGNMKQGLSSIKLTESGPRITLQLLKVEEGVSAGAVLFHSYISKTPEEVKQLEKTIQQKKSLKLKRKKEQELNVARKQAIKKKKVEYHVNENDGGDDEESDSEQFKNAVGLAEDEIDD